MNKNEWYKVGEDIKKQVQHAIDTNDFSKLSKGISETVSHAANDVGKSINDVGKNINDIGKNLNDVVNDVADSFQKGMKQGTTYLNKHTFANVADTTDEQLDKKRKKQNTDLYRKPSLRPNPKLFKGTPPGSVSGVLCMLFGFGAVGISAAAALQCGFGILMGVESLTALSWPITSMVSGTLLGTYGIKLRNRVERYRRYVELVKDKLYCSIEELAGSTGYSKRFVRRDLKVMMKKQMFLQAHMDKKESCFIASDDVYEQYLLTQKQYEQLQIEKKEDSVKKKKMEKTKDSGGADSRVSEILEEGRAYIRVIRRCNEEIPGEDMSGKLDKLELLVSRIFSRVEENPELVQDLQKMLRYYLPTTQKLLEAYRDLDKQDVNVKNISDTKQEIEKTIDTINQAFEEFLDELFRDRAWDIQSDITVLNTMLKQDGYLKPDFEKGEKE